MDPDRERKYQDEIERLKSFLVQLDEQISEESLVNIKKVEMLEAALASRDDQVAELQSRLDMDHEAVLEQVEEENQQLKALLNDQEITLHKVQAERNNLASALDMMQANMQEEINMQVLAAKKQTSSLEEQLAKLQGKLDKVCEGQDFTETSSRHDDVLVSKLQRDLELQNHLIDQLNDEVNDLKRKMQNVVKGRDGSDGYVSKQYVRSIILSLARPPPGVARVEIWGLLVRALDMSDEETHKLGLLREQEATSKQCFTQGLSDVWISFLLNETADNSVSPTKAPP